MRGLGIRSTHLAVLLVVAVACSSAAPGPGASAATGAASPAAEKLVVVGSERTPTGSWALETDDAYFLSAMGVSEGLTRIDFDGSLKPSLATQWTQTGPTTWEFTLRGGVKFHDGTSVDAAAVTTALTHLLGVKTPARSFNTRTVSKVEAAGTDKVRITTVAPAPLLPLIVASPNTGILAAKAYAQSDRIDPVGTGTGPFVMVKDEQPQSAQLKANENYWGGKVGIKEVEYRFVTDPNTRSALARSGEAQLVRRLGIAAVPQIKADPNLAIEQAPVPRTTTLYLNNTKPPLNDVRVRQAIQAAIDVRAIAGTVLEGAVIPAVGPFAPTTPYAPTGAQPVSQDLEKAKRLLSEAGVDPAKLTLSLWTYPGRPELPTVATAIQAMLKKAGINVEIRVAEYSSMEADALAGKHDLFLISRGYLSDVNDPLNYLVADFGCKGAYRMSQFCSQAVDDQLAKASTLSDTAQRYAIYKEIAAQVQSQAVSVFVYHEANLEARSVRLQNYKVHPLDNYVLTPELTLKAK